jgi:hypothetical protein
MAETVTIESKGPAGETYEIGLERTSTDGGTIKIKTWRRGQYPASENAASNDSYELYDIRARSPVEIVCRANVFGPDPVVTLSLREAAQPAGPAVQVVITGSLGGSFDGTSRYPLAPKESQKLKQFLAHAAFPVADA